MTVGRFNGRLEDQKSQQQQHEHARSCGVTAKNLQTVSPGNCLSPYAKVRLCNIGLLRRSVKRIFLQFSANQPLDLNACNLPLMGPSTGKVYETSAFRIIAAVCSILVCAGADRAQTLRARVSVLPGSSAGFIAA